MTKLAVAAVMATLFAGPAFSQAAGNLGSSPSAPVTGTTPGGLSTQGTVADPNRAPNFTQGSGQRAGGPANELNTSTGGAPRTTGSVVTPGPTNEPNARALTQGDQRNVPVTQQGSGQQSGGPARELNRAQ